AVNETEIQTVDVLSFKADASDPTNIKKGTFFYRAQGVYTETSPGQGKVEVRLTGSPERQTLVVLANARRQVDALGAAYGEQKEDVMSRLTFDAGTDASPDFANGIPMWGELPNETVGEGFSPSGSPKEVTMIRSVAKFTLVNPAEHDPEGKDFFFYYDLLRLYNYRSKGRIAPDNYNAAGKKVDTPTVPADARQPRETFASLDSEVTSGRIGIYEGRQKSFYLCEVDNAVRPSGGNALDDLCLIVYVKSYSPPHSGVVTSGYYRLDFRSYPGDTRMDILRNHDYQIKVESVEGLPAQTADEAYKGNHTLKCRIVPWNQVQEEVKVSGNKRLSVDRRVFDFDGDIQLGVASLPVKITTENTQWSISGQPSWITLSQTSGTAGVTATVTVSANSKNFGQNARSGVLTIHAGNLQYRLHVKQEPACGFGNNMKLMRIGNNNYMTTRVTNGGVCWMIDASKEGGPNMAARPRTYIWAPATVGPIYYGSIPHRACPDGWRLPTAWEVIDLIQKISGSYPAVFTRLTESGCGMAQGAPPSLSAPTSVYESYLAIWTQTPMSYSPVSPRHSPASVLWVGGQYRWKSGSTTEVEFRYAPTGNRWCLVHSAGSDIYSPAGLPANFNQYIGVHYLNGGSVRAVHE
ncbi:BACON domain-containing protein, partial [Bacteroides sp. KG156]